MSNIGALSVSIEGDNSSLNRALTDSQSRMDRFGSMAARVALSVAKIGAAAAGAAAALGIATVRNVANAADEMAKLSQRTGVAVEDLGRLSHAANLSGVSQGELTTSLTRLSRAMQDASNGTGTATQAFSRLGVSVTDAEGNLRSQADVMSDVADRFARMEDGATKTALAQEIFGRSGANLIPMLNQGSQGLKQMGDEAERLGLVFDEKTTKAAEQLNDNITRLRGAVQGAAREFSGPIIGALARFTEGMYESYLQSQDLYNEIGKTDNIMRAMNAFKGLGDVISRALDNWTAFFFASPQQQYNKLLQERIALEDKIRNIELDARDAARDVGASDQRRIDRYKEEIEAIRQQMAVMAEMQANRQKMESRQAAMMDPLVILGIPEPEVVRERLEQINEIIATNHDSSLQRLREFGMSESELEMERHKQRMTALAEAFFDEAITHEEQHAMLERLQEEHANRMTRITEREAQNRSNIERRVQQDITNMRNAAFSAGVGLLQAFGSESKVAALAAIALNKGLMIAQVIQNTAAAQMRALAELGPIAGPPAAAKIGMYGRLQAGIIAATGLMQAASAGGGNAATASGVTMSSVAGSSGMATTGGGGMVSGSMDRPRTPATATINIVGESFTRSQVAQLIDAINDLTADGARLVIA
jgi:hypothetical protein